MDDPETLTHRALGGDYASLPKDLPVTITDDAPDDVMVSFGAGTYTVAEGASVTVTVGLDVDPERTVSILLTATNENDASNADYSGVPSSVTFNSRETSKTFSFTATDDSEDDDGERVSLGFGTLPSGVSDGTAGETVVSITDDDAPDDVMVSFGAGALHGGGGGQRHRHHGAGDVDPERTVSILLTATTRTTPATPTTPACPARSPSTAGRPRRRSASPLPTIARTTTWSG